MATGCHRDRPATGEGVVRQSLPGSGKKGEMHHCPQEYGSGPTSQTGTPSVQFAAFCSANCIFTSCATPSGTAAAKASSTEASNLAHWLQWRDQDGRLGLVRELALGQAEECVRCTGLPGARDCGEGRVRRKGGPLLVRLSAADRISLDEVLDHSCVNQECRQNSGLRDLLNESCRH